MQSSILPLVQGNSPGPVYSQLKKRLRDTSDEGLEEFVAESYNLSNSCRIEAMMSSPIIV